MKYFTGVILTLILIGFFVIKTTTNDKSENKPDKVQVAASFYPVFFFASEIGGEKAQVASLIPAGSEPHDYELTPKDMTVIQKANLLVLNGAGLEPWSDRVLLELPEKVTVVFATENLTALEDEEGKGDYHEYSHENDYSEYGSDNEKDTENGEYFLDHNHHEHEHGGNDPHVWLSPLLAVEMVDNITQGFVKADPKNTVYYTDKAEALKIRLVELDTKYRQELSQCVSRNIVTSHTAFTYLAASYNLNQIPIAGLSPEEEPSLQELVEITDFVRANNVKYIFFETLVSSRLAETIATEVGAKTLVLDPIEGITQNDIIAGETYFSLMERNLTNLKIALECKK